MPDNEPTITPDDPRYLLATLSYTLTHIGNLAEYIITDNDINTILNNDTA